ncbi:hypothetical protein B0J14DRAFT_108569 [Halenospora varia]|nr:hypothetical protein B0J14DRAFT_108569 [Halenospora varia]
MKLFALFYFIYYFSQIFPKSISIQRTCAPRTFTPSNKAPAGPCTTSHFRPTSPLVRRRPCLCPSLVRRLSPCPSTPPSTPRTPRTTLPVLSTTSRSQTVSASRKRSFSIFIFLTVSRNFNSHNSHNNRTKLPTSINISPNINPNTGTTTKPRSQLPPAPVPLSPPANPTAEHLYFALPHEVPTTSSTTIVLTQPYPPITHRQFAPPYHQPVVPRHAVYYQNNLILTQIKSKSWGHPPSYTFLMPTPPGRGPEVSGFADEEYIEGLVPSLFLQLDWVVCVFADAIEIYT